MKLKKIKTKIWVYGCAQSNKIIFFFSLGHFPKAKKKERNEKLSVCSTRKKINFQKR